MSILQEAIKRTELRNKIIARECENGAYESTLPGVDHEAFGDTREKSKTNLIITLMDMEELNVTSVFDSLFDDKALLKEVRNEIASLRHAA